MTPHVHFKKWQEFEVESTGSKIGNCNCCGTQTQSIWGFVHRDDTTLASYFVNWTKGSPDHGAWFDLIIGRWSNDGCPSHRSHIPLELRLIEGKAEFMVRNSDEASQDFTSIAHNKTCRDDIIGTDLASHLFAITDAVYMSDLAEEVRSWSS